VNDELDDPGQREALAGGAAATIQLQLESSPETLTLVRGALGGIAEPLALDVELLDDLKTAVSEACNNVVMHAYGGDSGPLVVRLYVGPEEIEVAVRDHGQGIPIATPADDRLQGVGIPIMRALAQRTAFRPMADGGTEVWLQFAGRREGKLLYSPPSAPAPDDGWTGRVSGDAVASLSPVNFVGGVLGRLARALAARARFSLDRFSDVYLVTDALAAHVQEAANGDRIGFGISTDLRRLEVTVGPLRAGAGAQLTGADQSEVGSALRRLSDELQVESADGTESVRVVMLDERSRLSAAG
jgi:anti-sigma regulatory factor (Ser/Thr protein kinase)